jgi:hypothetical protein
VAVIKKIEERTKDFITEYERLSKREDFPTHDVLASIIGAKGKGTITEILGKRQNIQPDQWEKFKLHFGISTEKSALKTVQYNDSTKEYSQNDKYVSLLENNDRFFKNEYAQLLSSLNKLIDLSKKQEALLKLNLQHVGAVEALQKGVEPEVVQEQINIQIADMGASEETDNDADN